MMHAVSNLFAELSKCGRELPESVAREILAFGSDAVPRLVEIAEDATLLPDDTHRWGRAHAVRLLVELRVEATFERLIRIYLATLQPVVDDHEQWEACVHNCPALGRPFLDRVFELLRAEPEHALDLAHLIHDFKCRDERVENLLDDLAQRHPQDIAMLLSYGEDEGRIPLMLRTLDKVVRNPAAFLTVVDLADAIEKLGGSLPSHVRAAVAFARLTCENEQRRLLLPCPCRSGASSLTCNCGLALRTMN